MCGVIGVIDTGPSQVGPEIVPYEVYRGLLTLQHRGQDAAGIVSYDTYRKSFSQHKELGLVADVFNETVLDSLQGNMAVGHTRYATVGKHNKDNLQPFVSGFPYGTAMAHNGNIVNYHQLVEKLKNEYYMQLLSSNDLEVMLQLWSHTLVQLQSSGNPQFNFDHAVKAAKVLATNLEGAYALVGMVADNGMFGLRDPNGIRPLVLGRKQLENGNYRYCFCSESVTLNFLGYEFVRDVEAGEFLFIDLEGNLFSEKVVDNVTKTNCMFEWIYFSAAESSIEDKSVYETRLKLGQVLARKVQNEIVNRNIDPDFVCPVPDTARTSSIALAESLKLPYREGLIKNRYVHRSFILKSQEEREKVVELKLSPVRSQIEGKNILLVDDSIVRGTTSRKIISLLKKYGANKITMALTCPPLRYGCYYGIDFPVAEKLIASNKSEEEIARFIGADKVIYLDEVDIKEAIGISDLCMACVNNQYPTAMEQAQEFSKRREEDRK